MPPSGCIVSMAIFRELPVEGFRIPRPLAERKPHRRPSLSRKCKGKIAGGAAQAGTESSATASPQADMISVQPWFSPAARRVPAGQAKK
jgi:hypothetical protein